MHLKQSVCDFRSLDSCSAFPFENYMQSLKRKVRNGKRPLVQILNRLDESQQQKISIKKTRLIDTRQGRNLYFKGDTYSVCEVLQIERADPESIQLYKGRIYHEENLRSMFTHPCESKYSI